MNNSAIEKGLFRAQALKKYSEKIEKNPASSQTGIFMKPDRNKVDGMKDSNYNTLTEEGYAKVETVIKDGDVIIGLVKPKATTREDEKPYKDNSVPYKSLVPGAIDKVITGLNNDGYPIIKIRVRSERIPIVGDKFSSRAGSFEPESMQTHWLVRETASNMTKLRGNLDKSLIPNNNRNIIVASKLMKIWLKFRE